jgi:hypothetical protein
MSNPDRPKPAGHADRSDRKLWARPEIRDRNVKRLVQGASTRGLRTKGSPESVFGSAPDLGAARVTARASSGTSN